MWTRLLHHQACPSAFSALQGTCAAGYRCQNAGMRCAAGCVCSPPYIFGSCMHSGTIGPAVLTKQLQALPAEANIPVGGRQG